MKQMVKTVSKAVKRRRRRWGAQVDAQISGGDPATAEDAVMFNDSGAQHVADVDANEDGEEDEDMLADIAEEDGGRKRRLLQALA
jgi:hypothetical protein